MRARVRSARRAGGRHVHEAATVAASGLNQRWVLKELDVTATELVDRQDASDAARSRLVQLCREFKKTAPHDVRCLVSPLLRHFQAEVDRLGRAKPGCRGRLPGALQEAAASRLRRPLRVSFRVHRAEAAFQIVDGTLQIATAK
ncbi:hypothetical protein MTO96_002769 [Rhipicephalus appendiculatus]